ncbi:MAG: hypothetical protein E7356_03025 [Clostridiales bacterium]|nr:hypothetical protein [Clostridiales bacterium]
MEQLYLQCKNYLTQYDSYQSYEDIRKQLLQICKVNYDIHNCNLPLEISFEEDEKFGNQGKVVNKYHIKINTLRIETLKELKIDCFDPNHISNLYDFYANYNPFNSSKYEQCLYEYIKKYISLGYQDCFDQMGSYKNIKYEILETILHESKHTFQSDLLTQIYDNNTSLTEDNCLDFFVVIFDRMYKTLRNNNTCIDYVRDNATFPIEHDARHYAMVTMDNIRKLYFAHDKDFARAIVNSNIIPEDINVDDISKKIFDDYTLISNEYFKTNNDFAHEHQQILAHKNDIINKLISRYNQMLSIVSTNREILYPHLTDTLTP